MTGAARPARHADAPPRVLVVDDIADNRILLERGLASSGYDVVSVPSGQEALAWLAECDGHLPAVILLDWMMPGLNGLETLIAIREIAPASRLPVIMCTAVGEEDHVIEAMEAGANDYVVKPFSLPILRARMSVQIGQAATVTALDRERDAARRLLTERTRALLRVNG